MRRSTCDRRGVSSSFVGENGAGKTNLLEALSLSFAGTGPQARRDSRNARASAGSGGFALSVEVEEDGETRQLGSAWAPATEDSPAERINRIDRAPVPASRGFADHVRVVWLTPAMDPLFGGPASERRRFLDRLVLAIDPGAWRRGSRSSSGRCAAATGSSRRRSQRRLGLDAIEREAAELGVAIAAARPECVGRLAALIEAERDDDVPFPWAGLALQGDVEPMAPERAGARRRRTATARC